MANTPLPTPSLALTNQEARRFMLSRLHLWPPRKLRGKKGILSIFDRWGCIQYDTINIVGRNADLVLQSRIDRYRPSMLNRLLYEDRALIDGFDKVASIYKTSDWPYFARQRAAMPVFHEERSKDAMELAPKLLKAIRERGPSSSLDFKDDNKTEWFWAPTSLSRASLEILYAWGKLGVHHKVNTRRVFDLIERLLPADILAQKDPNKTLKDYHDWHVLRRIGSAALVSLNAGEHWLGIRDAKAPERRAAIQRLVDKGEVIPVAVEGLDKQTLYMRTSDKPTLDSVQQTRAPKAQAAFIAPLDNLMWNRKLIDWLFDFSYVWEVYKPKAQRQYGYYVLPVLYGDKFIARVDPGFDKKTKVLTINGWWWEDSIKPSQAMLNAIARCILEFGRYLEAVEININPALDLAIEV